ncbi:MAG TPA: hypothetical protein VM513_09385 [Kofleriaceae bacterium]|jgi:cysteine-rich repeat protein|nr:hypothetical protein [Kofleriaceae bacterium]
MGLRWVMFALLLLAACVQDSLVPCGDRLCPSGSVCVVDRCATPTQLDACSGAATGDPCTIGAANGRCDEGICELGACGNGVVDVGEACDDENTASGDGCRGDCGKLEVCGDAALDEGEGCDDGNDNPADGCDACTPTQWNARALIGGSTLATSVGMEPGGVAVDRAGNLYIGDTEGLVVRRVDTTGIVTTIAGTGTDGYSGDGGPAVAASMGRPFGLAVDGLGNVYIADGDNHRIRKIDLDGIITTFAGTGTAGYSGDGGLATSAQLSRPGGVAVDGLGNVYIADSSNARIRKVDASGRITTFAGTGVAGFSGDGGPATAAEISSSLAVAVDDGGQLYITDQFNRRIRRVDASGVIRTIAGNGGSFFAGDGGPATSASVGASGPVAVDLAGNVYVSDGNGHRVRRIDTLGVIMTIAGGSPDEDLGDGGPAVDSQLYFPSDLAIDRTGNLYIADVAHHRVRRIDPAGTITTAAGTGDTVGATATGATTGHLYEAAGICTAPNGSVLMSELAMHRIRQIDANGVLTTFAGTGTWGDGGDGGPASMGELKYPSDVAADSAGNVYIADTSGDRVRRVDTNGVLTTIAGTGVGGFAGDGGPAIAAQLYAPVAVALDAAGNVFVTDSGNFRIRRIDTTGTITTVAGTGVEGFNGDGIPATTADLDPWGIALDAQGNLYIADDGNARVRRVDKVTGIITTVVGTGVRSQTGEGGPATSATVYGPHDLTFDAAGNLLLADYAKALRVDAVTQVITAIAGTGATGFTGDGGPATSAELGDIEGIAVDAAGNVYLMDSQWDGISRRVAPDGTITTFVGPVDPVGTTVIEQARLADVQALAIAPAFTLFAGGFSGTVQAVRPGGARLAVVTGRYPHEPATANLARFRDRTFGAVGGVAYDSARGRVFVTETSANRVHVVTIVDPANENTWTIEPLANAAGTAGFADGAAAAAKFRAPAGMYFDAAMQRLYVADAGNHVVRAIDVSGDAASATVSTIAGVPMTRGIFGDGGAATAALFHTPKAITRCANGDVFIADTNNHRIRRIAAGSAIVTTVLGDGVPASSGEGQPASTFPVDTPLGLACDGRGNLFVTSSQAVRLLPADAAGVVDGTGPVQTIYGAAPRDTFPASVTSCLTGIAVVDDTHVQVTDACAGMLVELAREPR